MKNKLIVIRVTLWWGIIADLIETVRMIIPQLFISTTRSNAVINNDFRFALLYGFPVMLGWVLLLLWADHKPVERRGIFLCLIPVIISYFIVEITGIKIGVLNLKNTIPTFILQIILLSLGTASFLIAGRIAKDG